MKGSKEIEEDEKRKQMTKTTASSLVDMDELMDFDTKNHRSSVKGKPKIKE
jgi:hypothetical protein